MRKLAMAAIAVTALVSTTWAQEDDREAAFEADAEATHQPAERVRQPATVAGPTVSLGELQPTPEMWFYEQERLRYQNPKEIVRQKAEVVAAARRNRIESRRWFGYSNSRPRANITPLMGNYSYEWVGNSYNPYYWRGTGGSTIVVGTLPRTTSRW